MSKLKGVGIKKIRSKNQYINNKELLEAFVNWQTKPDWKTLVIPDKIAIAIMKISENLSSKHNFANYTFREDMIGDGIENCIKYVTNFDPAKSSNPFAYFTQICYYAFIRRIQKEAQAAELNVNLIARAKLAFTDDDSDDDVLDNSMRISKQEFEWNKFEIIRQMETANTFNVVSDLVYENECLELLMDE